MIRLPTGLAPGGLVFVLYDGADVEIERTLVTGRSDSFVQLGTMATRHAERLVGGGTVRAFDGDTGRQVSEIRVIG